MTGPFYLYCSDNNKKNVLSNGGNNGHGLKKVFCKQTIKGHFIYHGEKQHRFG